MAYEDFIYLTRRTAADNVIRDRAFNTGKNRNMMDNKVDLLQWLIKFLVKKFLVGLLSFQVNL